MLSMVTFGCKGLGSGDEDVESLKKYDKVWTKENSSENDYLRFFDQFGTSKSVKTATVQLKVGNAKNSKAGLVFSLTENEDKTVSFYVLGVGANYSTGTPEYYLDYYAALDPAAMSQTSTGERIGSQEPKEVVKLTNLSGVTVAADGSMTVFAKIDVSNPGQISVKFGPEEDNLSTVINPFAHSTYNPSAKDALGGIGAYGMLRPASAGQTVKTTNSYTVLESDPDRTFLAAE